MKDQSLQKNFTELNETIKKYINTKINYWKIVMVEKVYKVWASFFLFTLLVVSFLFVFLLLAFAFAFWYGQTQGDLASGFLISAGAFVIIVGIVYLLRKPLFSNHFIRKISSVIFDDEDEY